MAKNVNRVPYRDRAFKGSPSEIYQSTFLNFRNDFKLPSGKRCSVNTIARIIKQNMSITSDKFIELSKNVGFLTHDMVLLKLPEHLVIEGDIIHVYEYKDATQNAGIKNMDNVKMHKVTELDTDDKDYLFDKIYEIYADIVGDRYIGITRIGYRTEKEYERAREIAEKNPDFYYLNLRHEFVSAKKHGWKDLNGYCGFEESYAIILFKESGLARVLSMINSEDDSDCVKSRLLEIVEDIDIDRIIPQ